MKRGLKAIFFIFCLSSVAPVFLHAQEWVRTYSNGSNSVFAFQMIESYDNGFIMGADMTVGVSGFFKIGWIIKLNENGNILWDRKLGNGLRIWSIYGLDNTPDGGLIITGGADTLNNTWYDPWIAKLNACGDLEWCRVFYSGNKLNNGVNIKALPDSSFVLLLFDWKTFPESSSAWLMHLNQTGSILWEQEYFTTDSLIMSENPKWLSLTSDGKYLITGTCDHPDSGQVSPWWVQPMLIMADTAGQAVWELPWGSSLNCGGEGFQSVVSGTSNNVYTSICRYPHGSGSVHKPALIKTTSTGSPASIKNLKDSIEIGKATTIDNYGDTVFFIGTRYKANGTNYLSILKTDTTGNLLNEKVLNNKEYYPSDAMFTFDKKYLITAADWVANKYVVKLWKLKPDLSYDTLYTQPHTYDSLCPHPIVSGTIYPSCDVLTGMQESAVNTEKVRMHVFPNPAHGVVHVQLPPCIQRKTQTAHLNVTTVFHRWSGTLTFAAFDGFGRRLYQRTIQPGESEFTLDTSGWPAGIVLLRLEYLGTQVATEKVVIEL